MITLEQLGCTPMHATNGTTTTIGDQNANLLNAHYETTFRTARHSVEVPIGGWGFTKSIMTRAKLASGTYSQIYGRQMRFAGGHTNALSELQYASDIGGEASRIVCLNKNNLTPDASGNGALIIDDSYGLVFEGGACIQGWWHPANQGTLVAPGSKSNYAPIGILVKQNQDPEDTIAGISPVGNGKLQSASLAILCCRTGIQCGETDPEAHNADQLWLGDFRALHCDIGIHLKTLQSVGHTIGQFEGLDCDVMCFAERGGKLFGGNWTLIKENGTMLKTGGNQVNDGSFTFAHVTIDGAAGAGCKLIEQTGVGTQAFTIDFLHLDGTDVYTDLIRTLRNSQVVINGGVSFNERMWKPVNDGSGGIPSLTIRNCRFKQGHNPANIVSLSASGAYMVMIENCFDWQGNPLPDMKWKTDQAGVVTRLDNITL